MLRQQGLKAVAIILIFSLLAGLFSGLGPSYVAQAASFSVDGVKDDAWTAMEPVAVSPESGWSDFDIGNLYITNDEEYLYFWLDAVNVPNWGENGQYLNLALQVNGADSGIAGNPWASQFHFGGAEAKPQFHVVMRLKNDSEVNWAAVYAAPDLGKPLLASDNLMGAQFAMNRSIGFEGKIPLSLLNLQHGDTIRPIAVLSGNNSAEHGAFDVAPRAEGNTIADSWNVSGAPNAQSVYGSQVTISIPGSEIPELPPIASPTYHEDGTVSVFTTASSNEHWINGNFPAAGGWSTFQPMQNIGTFLANGETVQLFRYTFTPADAQATGGVLQYKFSPVNAWNGDYIDLYNHSPLVDGNSAVHYLFIEPNVLQVEPGGSAAVEAYRFLADGTKEEIAGGVVWKSSQPDWAAVDAQGVVSVSPDAVSGRTFEITSERNGVSVSKSYTVSSEVVRSPVVHDDGTVTFNNNTHSGETLHLVGSMNGWNNQGIAMTKNELGVFSVTIPLATGRYEYKFFPVSGSWDNGFTDPLNPNMANGNSLLYVPGITAVPADETVSPGQSVQFNAKFLASDGSETAVSPEWSLGAGAREGVTIDSATGLLTVQPSVVPAENDSVTAVATYENNGRTFIGEATVMLASQTTTFVVHYFRYDQNYGEWNLWAWLDGHEGQSFPAVTETVDGKTWARMTVDVAGDASKLNFIVRKGNWAEKEFSDRSMTAADGFGEVWVVEGDEEVHNGYLPSLTDPAVRGAIADETGKIKVTLTNKPLSYGTFEAWDGNRKLAGVSAMGAHDKAVVITLEEPIADVRNVYTVKDASGVFKEKRVMMRGILDSFVYSGADLGVTFGPEASAFKVWAPTAANVSVSLYANATAEDQTPDRLVPMTRDNATGVWSAVVEGDWKGWYYLYKVEFSDGTTTYANDPYARAASVNGLKTAIVDLSTTDPVHWNPESKPYMVSPTDAVIYELHVRDFSMNERSGIAPEYRGKYKAFTQKGTTDPVSGAKTGVDHLVELGVTHLHLLPTYDFGSIDETKVDDPAYSGRKFNWGYDPIHFNVPEGSYATDLTDPTARITEFKEMVQALHDRGIRVILDVVYNHTLASGQTNPASVFDKIVPGYYFRSDDKGKYTDGSGTGNEVASERPMVRKYILDSTRFWAEEYNVDGFRFDLMGLIDTPTMTEVTRMLQQEVHPTMLVYGEPWVASDASALPSSLRTVKGTQRGKSFAVFNDNHRGAIKGGSDNDSKGFATGAVGTEQGIVTGVKGSWEDFTDGPTETINYVTAHDNLNLWDKVIKTQHLEEEEGWVHIEHGKLIGDEFASVEEAVAAATPHHAVDPNHVLGNETVKRSLLANGIAITAQGIPFIHAGEELLRTKFGDHNSYASPDAINEIRWEYKTKFAPVFDYYEGLLKLRKEHPAFRMSTKEAVQQGFELLRMNGNVVAYKLKNHANNDPWNNIVVIYNANVTDQTVTLPVSASGNWNVVVNESAAGTETLATVSDGSVLVKALSMMVLYDQAELPYTPEATTLQLDASSIALEPGMSKFIRAAVLDQKGRSMNVPIEYVTSDEQVASVNGLGKVTGVADGTATITVSAGELTAELNVVVGELIPTQLTIQGPSSLYVGDSVSLTALVKDQYGQPMNGISVSWSSSNSAVADVAAGGIVTGLAEGTTTVTASAGQVVTEFTLQVKRPNVIALHYVRPDGNFADMDVWAWNTGLRNNDGHSVDFAAIEGTTAIALIPVSETATSVGFIVRKKDWSFKDTDQDRYIPLQPSEAVKKVIVTSGVVEYVTVPSIRSPQPSEGKLRFRYRDRDRFALGTLGKLSGVKAVVDGVEHDAVYDELNEAWVYTLDKPQDGHTYVYTFLVEGEHVTDPNNPNVANGKAVYTYEIPKAILTAETNAKQISYDTNALLTVSVQGATVPVERIRADLSALGYEQPIPIDLELMQTAFGVKDGTSPGRKPIRVIVTYENGMESSIETSIVVVPGKKSGKNDFSWDEARIYFLLTDRFMDGDPSNNEAEADPEHPEAFHGGDFRGLIDKLDYLERLGINTIWITPIVDNVDFNKGADFNGTQYAYHGYWAKDFTKIDEHLGDLQTFQELLEKAHDRGMKVMVDVVLNHAGYGLKPDDDRPGISEEDKARFDGMLRTDGVACANGNEIQCEVWGLPDLKTEEAATRERIIDWQAGWLERTRTARGDTIDYFRVDTVKHVDATTWRAFKNRLAAIDPKVKLLGEYFDGSATNQGGTLNSGQMDSLLDFDFKWLALDLLNGGLLGVNERLQARNDIIDNTAMLGSFLSSHDEDGFLSERIGGDRGKLKVAAALQMTVKGQPVIYYGEELGRSGKNSGDMAAGQYSENRGDMPWDRLDEEADLLNHYTKMLRIRANHSDVFAKGTHSDALAGSDEEGTLVFARSYEGRTVFVGLNVTTATRSVKFKAIGFAPGATLVDEYSGGRVKVDGEGFVTVTIPPRDDGGTVVLAKAGSDKAK